MLLAAAVEVATAFCLAESMLADGVMHAVFTAAGAAFAGLLHAMLSGIGAHFRLQYRGAAHSAWRALRTWWYAELAVGRCSPQVPRFSRWHDSRGLLRQHTMACGANGHGSAAKLAAALHRCSARLHRTRDMQSQSPAARTDR